jgi:Delta7-sterol 5-desaturase
MDIELKVVDYYFADWAYAYLPPATSPSHHTNTTSSASHDTSAWEYHSSTPLFHLEPTNAAYESTWTRDNIYRQATSLSLITW